MCKWLPGVLTKAWMPTVKTKQCEPKLFGSQARFVCEAKCAGNHTRDSRAPDGWMRKRGGGQGWLQITVVWLSTDSRCSKAAEALCAYQRVFWYRGKELRNRWTEKLLTKMHFHRGKGICQNSWRKWMRYPRRLRVPSLNKIAQAAAQPSPLWEFRAANCFRDFIVALQNENPRWSGPSYLNRIPGTRRSVAEMRLTIVNLPPWMQGDTLGKFEMIFFSKSQMKPITNLCSQPNIATPNSLFDMTNDYLFEMNMTFLSKWGFAPAWYSHSALCKLSFALVNDKLQEAEYDKHRLPVAGAGNILLRW